MTQTPSGKYSICYMLFNEMKSFITSDKEKAKEEFRRINSVLAKHRRGRPERVW